ESINQKLPRHILTVEDPIEYLYRDKKSLVNQREVGIDVASFRDALKYVVRQDPDVILIGEMRDQETFEAGLQAAETGHLVFGTIHASSVAQTMGRILDLFPPEREKQIRESMRFNLRAIVCQKILPSCKAGVGMVPSQEVMVVNATIAKLIVDGQDKKIEDVIRGAAEEGMQDFNQSLLKLVKDGLVDKQVAFAASPNPEQLSMNLKGIFLGEDRRIVG
ncbi:MAG: Flp pilus assembly complex ATPase component TadA, partial [Planctomycetes bacterium]|nr:Flp pilus assembly complex ATPase component TadA [Planctomycetota bacterium]